MHLTILNLTTTTTDQGYSDLIWCDNFTEALRQRHLRRNQLIEERLAATGDDIESRVEELVDMVKGEFATNGNADNVNCVYDANDSNNAANNDVNNKAGVETDKTDETIISSIETKSDASK